MPTPIRYPLDPTGLSPDNYIAAEAHVTANLPRRAVIPTYGAFFTASMKVYDAANNRLLVKGTDYLNVELLTLASEMYGKEICQVVLIINATVSNNIRMDYQALGGLYERRTESMINLYNMIENGLQTGNVAWPSIIARPSVFNPTAHLHSIEDVYGWQFVATAIEEVKQAIQLANAPAHEQILNYTVDKLTSIERTVNQRLDNGSIPAVSAVAGNTLVRQSDGLYVPTGGGGPAPAPTDTNIDEIGLVSWSPFATVPTGFIKANGATISRTVYAALFAKYGIKYGAGDGATTFTIIDLRGQFPRGWDDGRGIDTGRVLGSEQTSQNLAHTHTESPALRAGATLIQSGPALGISIVGATTGSSGGSESRPVNTALQALIRYLP